MTRAIIGSTGRKPVPLIFKLKIIRELLNMADARVGDLLARNLFQRAQGHPGGSRDVGPVTAGRSQAVHYKFVEIGVHKRNDRPIFGFTQPTFGFSQRLNSNAMTAKREKVPGFMREVLADNVKRLMEHHYAASSNQPKALAKDADVSLSTVQRILGKKTGATLDNIESIATAFHLSVYQIMVPALHIENPQVIKGATLDEERLYRNWKRSRQASLSKVPS